LKAAAAKIRQMQIIMYLEYYFAGGPARPWCRRCAVCHEKMSI